MVANNEAMNWTVRTTFPLHKRVAWVNRRPYLTSSILSTYNSYQFDIGANSRLDDISTLPLFSQPWVHTLSVIQISKWDMLSVSIRLIFGWTCGILALVFKVCGTQSVKKTLLILVFKLFWSCAPIHSCDWIINYSKYFIERYNLNKWHPFIFILQCCVTWYRYLVALHAVSRST